MPNTRYNTKLPETAPNDVLAKESYQVWWIPAPRCEPELTTIGDLTHGNFARADEMHWFKRGGHWYVTPPQFAGCYA